MNVGSGDEDWGGWLRRVTDRPGWSVARLSRESGFSKAAIFEWISAGSGETVKVGSVVAVARAAGEDPVDALVAAAGLTQRDDEEPEIRAVRELNMHPDLEARAIEVMRGWQRRDQERRLQDARETGEMIRLAAEEQTPT